MAKIKVHRCGHSGLYLPGDYYDKWGSTYGRGLGPVPVSEVLNTQAEGFDPSSILRVQHQGTPDTWMLPVGESMAPVEMLMVPEEELGSAQEQWTIQEQFKKVNETQYEKIGEKKVLMTPAHPDYDTGNRVIVRIDDPGLVRTRNVLRKKQQASPHWPKLQAMMGALSYNVPNRTTWA